MVGNMKPNASKDNTPPPTDSQPDLRFVLKLVLFLSCWSFSIVLVWTTCEVIRKARELASEASPDFSPNVNPIIIGSSLIILTIVIFLTWLTTWFYRKVWSLHPARASVQNIPQSKHH